MSDTQAAEQNTRRSSWMADALRRQFCADLPQYILLGVIVLTAAFIAPTARMSPDVELVSSFLTDALVYTALFVAVACAWFLMRQYRTNSAKSPFQSIRDLAHRFFVQEGGALTFVSTILIFTVFSMSFAVLKSAIAFMKPFTYDRLFADMDRVLHLGYLPHEWLMPLFGSPEALLGLNIAYHLWFSMLLVSFVACALMAGKFARIRQQYMVAFLLVWFVGGFVCAVQLSSAGPAFFALIGEGDDYAGLMAHLNAANDILPVWSLETHKFLWQGYIGLGNGFAGISAMPSMHVAIAVLFALAAWSINHRLGVVMWIFAALIQIGSVMLAWHYAVDGYAGAIIAVAAWKVADVISKPVSAV